MRLDALLPVILIACLLALAYFLTKAVQAAQEDSSPPNTQVRLNPEDYQEPTATTGGQRSTDASTNGGTASSSTTADLDRMYDDAGRDEGPSTAEQTPTTGDSYTPPAPTSSNNSANNSSNTPSTPSTTARPSTSSGSTATRSSTAGRYLVVAGSYRERVNAENQVRQLKREGFPDAGVEIFDRGTYALAVVKRFSRLSEAETLLRRVKASGFDAYVKDVR